MHVRKMKYTCNVVAVINQTLVHICPLVKAFAQIWASMSVQTQNLATAPWNAIGHVHLHDSVKINYFYFSLLIGYFNYKIN